MNVICIPHLGPSISFLSCCSFKTNDRASKATFHLQYRPESSDTICREDGKWKKDCLSDETCVFDGVNNKVFVHKCSKKLAPGSVCQVLFLYCELEPKVDKSDVVHKWGREGGGSCPKNFEDVI